MPVLNPIHHHRAIYSVRKTHVFKQKFIFFCIEIKVKILTYCPIKMFENYIYMYYRHKALILCIISCRWIFFLPSIESVPIVNCTAWKQKDCFVTLKKQNPGADFLLLGSLIITDWCRLFNLHLVWYFLYFCRSLVFLLFVLELV